MKRNRWKLAVLILTVLFALTACSGKEEGAISLSEEDKELLSEVEEDIHVISDDNYVETMTAINEDAEQVKYQLLQVEGMVKFVQVHDEEAPFLYRNYEKDGEKSELGVMLRYLSEEVEEGDWLRVTGIVTTVEDEGHEHTYFDVVTVETPVKHGSETLS